MTTTQATALLVAVKTHLEGQVGDVVAGLFTEDEVTGDLNVLSGDEVQNAAVLALLHLAGV